MVIITQDEYDKLKKELDVLKKVERPGVAKDLKEAISQGDLSENAAYAEAKERQIEMDGRMKEIEQKLAMAEIADEKGGGGAIQIGTSFRVRDEATKEERSFFIVGPGVSAPSEGKISFDSPLGKAFLNKKQGEEVDVTTPGGKRKYTVVEIL